MSDRFFKGVLVSNFGRISAQHCICLGVAVNLFVQADDLHATVGTTVSSVAGVDGKSGFCHTLHNHDFPSIHDSDLAVTGSPEIFAKFQSLPYSHSFLSNDDVLKSLRDVFSSGFHAWDRRAMRALGRVSTLTSRSSPVAHNSGVVAGEERDKDVVEVSMDEYLDGKKVSVLLCDRQGYECQALRLMISNTNKNTNPLSAVSQKHEYDLMDSLKSIKY